MKVLLVYGDGDGAARYFNDNYDPKSVYNEMLVKGVTKIDKPDDYGDDEIHVELYEFVGVDKSFISFLYEQEIVDLDHAENTDFFVVED
ncbi:hypothetical protein TROLL_48 [Bacillus phage Troll]|uniref:Uncharacterized protein n=6 Tax=Caudoviricetes TaxID=2731619 RepID=A0A7U3T8L1_9CAUD|nr:hypothetical protein TROLL_48 [Bacillus phage Troll]YP_009055808.1 hypothetical protein LD11_gp043 [Bacillus phage Riley]YP_009206401.1 hypothetical protein AVV02_gp046 [Bacillus phage AvesoBmore]YP_009289924.1 hypothetical protein BI003_gp045 [Bacillus phage Phrodo]ASZ75777.1 hypothetical protein TAFFO16_44 [Bacillus phage Taffo16]QPY77280.1 hypothetical protein ANTHOS_43 [Bacillus phage Anthos]ULF48665.1 hypothetical protein [Bacillus phage BillyBob]AGT13573.1 hypothetical protein TROLL